MPFKPNEIERLLQSKFGFSPAKSFSDDHRYYQLILDGLPPIVTKVSHNRKDIGPKLQGKIARQLRVKGPFFERMMQCSRNSADYQQQVRDDPYPPFDVRF